MAEKSDWKTKMRKHLGKSLQKHYDSLMLDIILICIGLKPSLLFDYSCIDAVKVLHLLEDFHRSGLTPVALDVVVLGQDLFITKVNSLLKALKENIKSQSFSLIDVSGNLEKPSKVTEETELKIGRHFEDLLVQLDELCSEEFHLPEIREKHMFNVDVKEEWNLSTMFGFLLCYPVIYWFRSGDDHNCLSLEPLHLYRAYVLTPFRLNEDMFKTYGDFVDKVLTETSSGDFKILFSFSSPEQLNSVVETRVHNWAESIKKKSLAVCLNEQVIFDKTLVIEKEVIL